MRFVHLLLIAICLCSCGSPRWQAPEGAVQKEVSWNSGSLKERFYVNTLAADEPRIGPYVQWFESGVVKEKGVYKDGKKHDWWHYYNDKGHKEKKVLFELGEPKRTVIPSPHDAHYHHRHHYYHPYYGHFYRHPYW